MPLLPFGSPPAHATSGGGLTQLVTPGGVSYNANAGDLIYQDTVVGTPTVTLPTSTVAGKTQVGWIMGPTAANGPTAPFFASMPSVTINGLTPSAFNTIIGQGSIDFGAYQTVVITAADAIGHVWYATSSTGNDLGLGVFANGGLSLYGPALLSGQHTSGAGVYITQHNDLVVQHTSGAAPVWALQGVEIGSLLFLQNKSGTIPVTFAANNTVSSLNLSAASAGTFTLSITGFTTTNTIAWNAPASTIQSAINDGVHGPAAAVCTAQPTSGIFAIYLPAAQSITGSFGGLTGGGSITTLATPTFTPTQATLPPLSSIVVRQSTGSTWDVLATAGLIPSYTLYTASTTVTPPAGTYVVRAVGGGAGGGAGAQVSGLGVGGGGGGGAGLAATDVYVLNGSTLLTITVGGGGNGASSAGATGSSGTTSTVTGSGLVTVGGAGGGPGTGGSSSAVGAPGVGGGTSNTSVGSGLVGNLFPGWGGGQTNASLGGPTTDVGTAGGGMGGSSTGSQGGAGGAAGVVGVPASANGAANASGSTSGLAGGNAAANSGCGGGGGGCNLAGGTAGNGGNGGSGWVEIWRIA